MLVGYVSDERYIALDDVLLEFEGEDGSVETRSRATGKAAARRGRWRWPGRPPGQYRIGYCEGTHDGCAPTADRTLTIPPFLCRATHLSFVP